MITMEEAKIISGIHYTTNHSGKMKGMVSLSTSCACNPSCKEYSKDVNKICSHCYAQRQMKRYSNMELCLEKNTKILTTKILSDCEIPSVNSLFFRFEAFGDLINEIQVINYFNICNKNPNTKFALWTKNPHIIKKTIDLGYTKPNNIQIILSSPYINVIANNKYDFVNKIFTVYDKKTIEQNNIHINCGAKNCLSCHKCYEKNEIVYINEKLK